MKKKVEVDVNVFVDLEIAPKNKTCKKNGYPVGSYVESHGCVYLVCEGDNCQGCSVFDVEDGQCYDWSNCLGQCVELFRSDRRSVIFEFVGYIKD